MTEVRHDATGPCPASDEAPPPSFVVCSLYHPDAHLDRQLETILAQDHTQLRVLLRDDGCDLETARLIDQWMRRDDRIEGVEGPRQCVGSAESYSCLIEEALARGAEWIALADQDDEWLPDHLSSSLTAGVHGSTEPIAIHGDLELIDDKGEILSPSFFAHGRIQHEERDPLRVLVVQNFVTGCATVINRQLAELAVPIPAEAIMHDWWLALCAASMGRLIDRGRTTVRYRQHGRNQIGAKPYGDVVRELGRRTLRFERHSNEPLVETVRQARALRHRLGERMQASAKAQAESQAQRSAAFLDRYLELFRPGVSRIRRSLALLRLGVGRQDPVLDLSLKVKLLTTPIEIEGD